MPEADQAVRPKVVLLVGGVVATACIVLVAAAWTVAGDTPPDSWRLVLAGALIAGGSRLQCSLRVAGDRVVFVWSEAALVLAAGLVSPGWLVLVTAPALALSLGLLPGRQPPLKASYNAAMIVTASALAMLAMTAIGATPLQLDSVRDVIGLAAAAVVLVVVSDLGTSAIIAVHTGRSLWRVQREGGLLQVTSLVGNLTGAAAVWLTVGIDPRLLAVAALAVVGVQQSYASLRRVQHEQRRRQELAAAVSTLARATTSPPDAESRDLVDRSGGEALRVPDTVVLQHAAVVAAELFAADVVEIELAAEPDRGLDRSWLYRWQRSEQDRWVVGHPDQVGRHPAPRATASLIGSEVDRGELRLGFDTVVTSAGLEEREQADLHTFAAAIPAVLEVARQQETERRLRVTAEHLATHDALTGLPNLHRLLETCTEYLALGRREGRLTIVEVCGLRELGGTVGHAALDRVLLEVSGRVRAAAVVGDVAARLDGGRFALLSAAESDPAGRLIHALASPVPLPSGTVALRTVTGDAPAPARPDAAEWLRRAEVALAAAHRTPDRAASYDPVLDVESTPRMILVTALQEALRCGELRVRYQLARNLATGQPVSVEALPAWSSRSSGQLGQDDLLDLVSVDVPGLQRSYVRWLLSRVLEDQREWFRRGVGVPVAVRLPRRSLVDPALPALVERELADADAAAERLVVCVDDALPDSASLDVTEIVHALSEHGVQISVDRLSVLEELPTLPVDRLRLPVSLVSLVTRNDRAAALVAGSVATASRLGLETTARGVDTEEDAVALRDMGCLAGQGEHVALPVESAKAGRYLWATGLLSEALHPAGEVIPLNARRTRPRSRS